MSGKGTVSFYTLGCKVNQYETQMLKERFSEAGYDIAGEEEFADIYIINTCTVTNLSDRKSRQYIRRMKKINPDAVIAVTGCYAQTDPETASEIEGVCIVAGTNEKAELVKYVEEYIEKNGKTRSSVESHILPYEELSEYEDTGIITSMDSRTRAYIKVQEGCNRFCSYCIIPYARGKVRSRRLDEIVEEARQLVSNGFKELVLTGINTALYGTENEGLKGIESLVAAISDIEGEFRIRLSSLEPNVVDADTVRNLMKYDKLCHHMHLSVQSGSDSVLKRMNRNYSYEDYLKIVSALKEADENYAITTDIIVGFPGETEEEFQKSIYAVNEVGFSAVHTFRYSKRRGTKAADMPDQIDGNTKNRRSEQLIQVSAKATRTFNVRNIGTVRRVLFEKFDDEKGMLEGHTDNYIKVYCIADDSHQFLDNFADIYLDSLYEDGILGKIITSV
jgi:threonylcarbamoyladenosine tRNA methylthiotransferase MtaB